MVAHENFLTEVNLHEVGQGQLDQDLGPQLPDPAKKRYRMKLEYPKCHKEEMKK